MCQRFFDLQIFFCFSILFPFLRIVPAFATFYFCFCFFFFFYFIHIYTKQLGKDVRYESATVFSCYTTSLSFVFNILNSVSSPSLIYREVENEGAQDFLVMMRRFGVIHISAFSNGVSNALYLYCLDFVSIILSPELSNSIIHNV